MLWTPGKINLKGDKVDCVFPVRGLPFPLQMHLVLILHVVAFGIVLINAFSVDENFKSGSVAVQNSFKDPMASFYTRGGSIQQESPHLFIKGRKLGYCLRRLSSMG